MKSSNTLKDLGESKLIEIIENLIFEKTNKKLIRDDAFFYSCMNKLSSDKTKEQELIFNSDMLVSTTDVPKEMNYYQIGRKAVLMNVSDIIVKGAKPLGIFISLGLPSDLKKEDFENLIIGIIDYCNKLNIDYIGGDINETKEIIINPSVFGMLEKSKIIKRKGMNMNDILVANGKFGLTGVGFDIILKKKGSIDKFKKYKRSINSVLEPQDLGIEGLILSKKGLATASIDCSDGLSKSLKELILSNPKYGFEIEFKSNLIDSEAFQYSKQFDISLENLIFNGGEEFIHLFLVRPKDYNKAIKLVQAQGGNLFKIGKVISDPNIYFIKDDNKFILDKNGFEHFSNNS
ncbi:MAG: thiamine-monophosphate kinase [Candidatus Lokiarchaeota archaeon]|nr:thiamine-monophosphate kinase [Candidatus Lokiarchaeota archaeon]